MSDKQKRILVGKFGAPHGVRGEVRLKSFTDDPLAIGDYGSLSTGDGSPVEIVSLRPQKAMLVARLKGCDSREAAEKLNGLELFIDRAELPETEDEDEFYLADLIGLEVRDASGEAIGSIAWLEPGNSFAPTGVQLRGPALLLPSARTRRLRVSGQVSQVRQWGPIGAAGRVSTRS